MSDVEELIVCYQMIMYNYFEKQHYCLGMGKIDMKNGCWFEELSLYTRNLLINKFAFGGHIKQPPYNKVML